MKTFHFVFIKWGANDAMKKVLDDEIQRLLGAVKVLGAVKGLPATVNVAGMASNAMGVTVLVELVNMP